MSKQKKSYRVMKEFRIDKISAVDRPAQEGATALIMKRDEDFEKRIPKPNPNESKADFVSRFMGDKVMAADYEDEKQRSAVAYSAWAKAQKSAGVEKSVRMLSDEDGHTHILDDSCMDYHTSYEKAPEDDCGHSHPWVKNLDGSIVIGMADGHTHELLPDSITVKREFSADERASLAEEGVAMSDGSFPIKTKADLENAVSAFGRAKNKSAVANHIARRAKALGASDMLPTEGALADAMSKAAAGGETRNVKENDMNEQEKAALEAANKRATDAEAALAIAKAFGALNDAERKYHDAQDEKGKAEFLGKSASERQSVLAKTAGENPVVYTTSEGAEFRKNDDPRLVTMAKQGDADRKVAREAQAALSEQTLAKRAEAELKHLPGELPVKVALLKAVDSIADESARKGALELLKANNEAMSKAFERQGTASAPAGGTTNDQLEVLAKKHATDYKVDIVKARVAVLESPEGQALYAQGQAR